VPFFRSYFGTWVIQTLPYQPHHSTGISEDNGRIEHLLCNGIHMIIGGHRFFPRYPFINPQ